MKTETKNLIKQILVPLGILTGIFVAIIISIYFCLFKPNFMRGQGKPTEMDAKHFLTPENEQKNKDDTAWFYSQNPEEITIESFDGFTLLAYNLPAQDAKAHGFCFMAISRDRSGNLPDLQNFFTNSAIMWFFLISGLMEKAVETTSLLA